jgi:hypothetical protein
MMTMDLSLPTPLGRGGVSASRRAAHNAALEAWCDALIELKATVEFDPGLRGWCYILEEHGLSKGDFDRAMALIIDCRKNGMLPLDFTSDEDVGRESVNVEKLDDADPEEEARRVAEYAATAHEQYDPLSLWEFQNNYVEMLVEKIGLKNLFEPVCAKYRLRLANLKGAPSIWQRAKLLRRLAHWQAKGKRCVVLYCGDHDVHGLRISEHFRSNLDDVMPAVQATYADTLLFDLDDVVIERFGLNADFIKKNRLSWTEGLVTGGGKDLADPSHGIHWNRDVQDYIKRFGARKVEADALVTRPEAGRGLCEDAIRRYVDPEGIEKWKRAVKRERKKMRAALDQLLGR